MIRFVLAAALALALAPTVARAQTPPSPTPAASPSPQASATPSPLGPAFGPNDPCTSLSAIVTRPTVTNSICTVRPGHVEIETGFQTTSVAGGGTVVAYPQSLVRIGLPVHALELYLTPPGEQVVAGSGATLAGTTDSAVGVKYVLGYTTKMSYSAQVAMTIPSGAAAFTSGKSNESYAFNVGYTLSPAFSLTSTLNVESNTNGAQRWGAFAPSLVLGATLPNSVALYGEIAEFTNANGPRTPTRAQYIAGASYDFTPRIQVDLETGFSPTVATGKYHYVGAGFSYYL